MADVKTYFIFLMYVSSIKKTFYIQTLQGLPPSSNANPGDCKRPAKPVNITPLCRLSPTCPNHIHITWSPKFGQVC